MITPQKQAFRHQPHKGIDGDCTRTCVAMLMGRPRDDVPHEHGTNTPEDYANWKERIAREFGVRFITVPLPPQDGWEIEDYCAWALGRGQGMPLMMGGESRNGTNHSVVIDSDGQLVDPAIDSSGIIGPCTDGFFWFEWLVAPIIRGEA
jgi:hypothetical protein